jgi:asparagine synthase (glutamine-hydrolysing)
VELSEIERMMNSVKHRGPDDEGYLAGFPGKIEVLGGRDTPDEVYRFYSPYKPSRSLEEIRNSKALYALGNRRLSILDLSPLGHQPQCSSDQTLWIVYNGEIYNFEEVRDELEGVGHDFVSGSDTEVILHAYKQWGENCVTRFNGMWAFAILDLQANVLFCSRDRFGVKPFFYFSDGQTFAFASEIKQILQLNGYRRRVNEPLLYDFLIAGRMAHDNQTCFEGVLRLPAGHNMIVNLRDLSVTVKEYYRLSYEPNLGFYDSEEAAKFASGIRELLRASVQRRLVSDVPICLSLSGGLDSSSIVCEAVSLHRSGFVSKLDLRPFTIRFSDPARDEGPSALAVARHLSISNKELYVDGNELCNDLETLAWYFDEPIFSSHMYAKWKLMQLMHKEGFKVTLDGQGGDEALCGYTNYYFPFLVNLLVKARFATFVHEVRKAANILSKPLTSILARTVGELAYVILPSFLKKAIDSQVFPNLKIIKSDFDERYHFRLNTWLNRSSVVSIQERLYQSELSYILPSHLHNEDRASMAFSVEMRLPFLDYRLVEYAFAIPGAFKIRDGSLKFLLREAMRDVLPDKVRTNLTKRGLEPPEGEWLNGAEEKLREYLRTAPMLDRYVDVSKALRNWRALMDSTDPVGHSIWRLLMVAVWLKVFFSQDLSIPSGASSN